MAFPLQSWIGYAGPFLLLPGTVTLAAGRRLGRTAAIAGGCVSLGILFVPVWNIPLHDWIRGETVNLSVTTLMLLVAGLIYSVAGRAVLSAPDVRFLMGLSAVVGLIFYPLALGFSAFDPYPLGYGSRGLVAVLLAASVVFWFMKKRPTAVAIGLAVFVWSHSLVESSNLWDALIDPLLVLSSWGYWAVRAWRRYRRPGS